MIKAIIIGIIAIVLLVLVIILYGQITNLKNLKQQLKDAENQIEVYRDYLNGVKKDEEQLAKINSDSKLSNFNAGLDLLRDK